MGTGHDDLDTLVGTDRRLRASWLVYTVIGLAIVTTVGLMALWPRGTTEVDTGTLGLTSDVVTAQVESTLDGPCSYDPQRSCHLVTFRIADENGVTAQEFEATLTAPRFTVGEGVVLNVVPDADPQFRYRYADRDRRVLLGVLALVFAAAVVGLGRMRGLAALGGLAASVLVLVAFIAPAIIRGSSPVLVAGVGGAAIALLALYLAHGWKPLTHVAAIGTFGALALTVLLSSVVIAAANFSGLASEETLLLTFVDGLDIRGLILAGTVLGAIGALDDITVTQASTIFELHRANPTAPTPTLFRAGLKVGRDHIASTVNTLLLAYAGASMPLLLLFTLSEQPLGFIANSEVVAVEVVRTLVGSIGLVAAVPLTTWLAARIIGPAHA